MPESRVRVVAATGNRGKIAEIRAALGGEHWEFVAPDELEGSAPDVEETGETFAENALIKATAYAQAFGMAALADDSGLEVDALDGEPGVRSARFAGEDASDAENNALLLERLDGTPTPRSARFRCAMALVGLTDEPVTAEGSCEGRILESPRGGGGFGYDPLFEPGDAPGKTMAELALHEKNTISHRGTALRALRTALAEAVGP